MLANIIDAAILISKITLQQPAREQRLDGGDYAAFKEMQEAMVLPSKGVSGCQEPTSPHPRATRRKRDRD